MVRLNPVFRGLTRGAGGVQAALIRIYRRMARVPIAAM
jgi:hypothetical protein